MGTGPPPDTHLAGVSPVLPAAFLVTDRAAKVTIDTVKRQQNSKRHQRFLIPMWSNLSVFSFVAYHTFLGEKSSLVFL